MEHRLIRHGDGWALVVEQDWLDVLGAVGEHAFDVDVRDGSIVVTPIDTGHDDPAVEEGAQRREAFEASLARVNERFAVALQRLVDEEA